MKKLLSLILVTVVATSCSVGTKKDLSTGLSVSYNGFVIGDAGLLDDEGQRKSNNQVVYGKKIAIVVDDIRNWEMKDGKVFPGLDLIVKDDKDVVVLEGRDILNQDGYDPKDATTLTGTITAGNPMKAGETYHAEMKIWDKLQTKSEIKAKVDIVVTENPGV